MQRITIQTDYQKTQKFDTYNSNSPSPLFYNWIGPLLFPTKRPDNVSFNFSTRQSNSFQRSQEDKSVNTTSNSNTVSSIHDINKILYLNIRKEKSRSNSRDSKRQWQTTNSRRQTKSSEERVQPSTQYSLLSSYLSSTIHTWAMLGGAISMPLSS